MYKDKLHEKGHGDEEQYFRRHDEELIRKLRERAHLHELTPALARKLEVDDPALLKRILDLGITAETGPAFLLAPLVQIAWAEGKVTQHEREIILEVARERGIAEDSPAHQLLVSWFRDRPSTELFQAALQAIRTGISVLPEPERTERVRAMIALCDRVARAYGGFAHFLGLSAGLEQEEEHVLAAMTEALGAGAQAQGR